MGNSKMLRAMMSAGALIVAGGLSGCASIVSGTSQVVSVETREASGPVAGASCKLQNSKGTYFVNSPGTVTVRRDYGNMAVQCEKPGLADGVASIKSTTKGMMYGNILFGGLIGAGVDHSSGAAYEYPPIMSILMGEPVAVTMPVPPAISTTYPVAAAPASARSLAPAPVMMPQIASPVPRAIIVAPGPVTVVTVPAAQAVPAPRRVQLSEIERVPFRAGVSSVTVENMAKQQGCVGGQGAGLMTPQGPVEMYRMVCSNGRSFTARCEFRQCRAM